MNENDRPVLSDFGLSRVQEELALGATPSNRPNGTLRYLSPELAEGTTSRSLGGDVWAWGCLFYYASIFIAPQAVPKALTDTSFADCRRRCALQGCES